MSTIRERAQQRERDTLSKYAALSAESKGRLYDEEPCPVRTPFQRDRDRILHSNAFRRLKDKTQVFLAPSGDHYRTRLTHTLEVSQISRTIARGLDLNEDLTEAIALGHDLGHTPFGHAGERALNSVFPGGFAHYEQSLRVADVLERSGQGLNLTYEVRDGILCHTKGKPADTLEGRIVKLSDKIAYINHDIDDAIRAGVIEESDIHIGIRTVLGSGKAERINSFVISVIENTTDDVRMGEKEQKCLDELNEFMFANVYTNPVCKGEESKAMALVCALYEHYAAHPDELPEIFSQICRREGAQRAACDYIAGMTDHFALKAYNDLFVPRMWNE
ncbi:MAG: deoxyguanosinetriphosphate triphosphohydrolase [Clostridiales bacterium]|nr:deoxyguanosinetriphosphate triphosphohydrolase [Clostridiales bacterium]